jgi:hypothetical protein
MTENPMRIADAFPVRHAEPLEDATITAAGIEHRVITVRRFPVRVNIPLVVTLAVPHVAAGAEHELTARVLGPDLTELAPSRSVNARFQPGTNTPPGWEIRSSLPMTIGFQAPEAGAYTVQLATDDHTYDVQVLVRAPDQPKAG